MMIHVFSMFWNEERMMPYFLRHYETFADRIVLFDKGSTDASRALAEKHPLVDLWDVGTGGILDEIIRTEVKNSVWKDSRGEADWVIVCDIDELIYHPNLKAYLHRCREKGMSETFFDGSARRC